MIGNGLITGCVNVFYFSFKGCDRSKGPVLFYLWFSGISSVGYFSKCHFSSLSFFYWGLQNGSPLFSNYYLGTFFMVVAQCLFEVWRKSICSQAHRSCDISLFITFRKVCFFFYWNAKQANLSSRSLSNSVLATKTTWNGSRLTSKSKSAARMFGLKATIWICWKCWVLTLLAEFQY